MPKKAESASMFSMTLKLLHKPRVLPCAVLLCALFGALTSASSLSPDESAQGWIQLFDGQSLIGWSPGTGTWKVNGGALISDTELLSSVRTTPSFSDFDLKFEARVSGGPATMLFRSDPQSKPAQPGYGLSLTDGTIAGINEGSAGATSAGWNLFEVQAEGSHVIVRLNGKTVTDAKTTKNRLGYFELVSPRGSHVEVRSILLKPLGLDSLYNGSNLDGWRAVDPPPPQSKSKFRLPIPGLSSKPKPPQSVRWLGQGTIHGEHGVGELESVAAYDDFVLQFTAKPVSPPREGQPGIEMFFRKTPNQFGSGYAVTVDSTAEDQRQKKSLATGSLVKLEKSRASSMIPGHFYTCTVVARAHRMTVWVDGVLVTDYYDSRPEGLFHAAAGALGFRIADDKASLDLREVKIASLPKGVETPPPPPQLAAAPSNPSAPPSAAPAAAPPLILPGPSLQEKAQQEQIRKLTVKALGATSPEEAVQVNKQILVLDPGDMPAQQRLDKGQAEINAANSQRQQAMQEQQASTATLQANDTRRTSFLQQAQDELLRGNLNSARDRLNDAHRLGANGPDVDRLHSLILSRLRNRLLLRAGLSAAGVLALATTLIILRRRRGKAATAYLVALDGVDKGKRYLLNQEVTHIGGVAMDGAKKNEVLVRDPDRKVSRFHCEVHKRGSHCYLIDLDSSNGTYLRKRPLPAGVAAKLRDGDQFTLARAAAFELRVERQRAG
jgi:hypothetical protein